MDPGGPGPIRNKGVIGGEDSFQGRWALPTTVARSSRDNEDNAIHV